MLSLFGNSWDFSFVLLPVYKNCARPVCKFLFVSIEIAIYRLYLLPVIFVTACWGSLILVFDISSDERVCMSV